MLVSLGIAMVDFIHKSEPTRQQQADINYFSLMKAEPNNGVYGFITSEGDFRSPNDQKYAINFLSAQYALAPKVLTRGGTVQRVIGWFPGVEDPILLATQQAGDVQLIGSYGNGVYLFQKRVKR